MCFLARKSCETFYNAKQQPDESVATWACRLETLITKAIAAGKISGTSKNDMLYSKFWVDLRDGEIKASTQHWYDTLNNNFDSLFHKVRMAEQEVSVKGSGKDGKKTKIVQSQPQSTSVPVNSDGDTMKAVLLQLQDLSGRMDRMQDEFKKTSTSGKTSSANSSNQWSQSSTQSSCRPRQSGGQWKKSGVQSNQSYRSNPSNQSNQPNDTSADDIICYKCGKEGHVAWGCRSKIKISQAEVDSIKASQRQKRSLNY